MTVTTLVPGGSSQPDKFEQFATGVSSANPSGSPLDIASSASGAPDAVTRRSLEIDHALLRVTRVGDQLEILLPQAQLRGPFLDLLAASMRAETSRLKVAPLIAFGAESALIDTCSALAMMQGLQFGADVPLILELAREPSESQSELILSVLQRLRTSVDGLDAPKASVPRWMHYRASLPNR